MKRKMVDLFCNAGGATRGYQQAGFYVVGVDNKPQPHYVGDEFFLADALTFPLDGFEAAHASPPCEFYSQSTVMHDRSKYPDLIPPTRERLQTRSIPWVIENVPGAPLRPDYKLCGCMFDLPGLRRERWFETSWRGFQFRHPCHHIGPAVTVAGHGSQGWEYAAGTNATQAQRRAAMGIDWMNRDELRQAIPPAFTEYIGAELLDHLQAGAA
jgi:DNA (cytosine-5)-methyltransferase 1